MKPDEKPDESAPPTEPAPTPPTFPAASTPIGEKGIVQEGKTEDGEDGGVLRL